MEIKTIIINTNIYPLRAVLSAAYVFLGDYYFFLNQLEPGKIKIDIKSKEEGGSLDKIEGEFNNEIINVSLRLKVFEENREVREAIVKVALDGIGKNNLCERKHSYKKDSEDISKTCEDASHIEAEKSKGSNFVNNGEKDGN